MEQLSVQVPPEKKSSTGSPQRITWRFMVVVFVASMFMFSTGSLVGYSSPALPNLNANRNPFRVTDEEQSWFASILCLGSAIGGVASGSACDLLGRKVTMMASSVFVVAGFTVVAAATGVNLLYVGCSILAFFAQIIHCAALLYVSEVTPADIRGTCVSLISSGFSMGLVASYAAGVPLAWNWLAVFVAALYTAPNLVLVLLPESPRWFLLKGNREAAIHGIEWLRGGVCDFHELRTIEQSLPSASNRDRKCDYTAWSGLLTDRKNLMSLFVCSMLFTFCAFSGNLVMQMFTVTIFGYVGATQIDPNMQTIISGLFLVAGSFLCPLLVDRVGRKKLMIASIVTVCVSMTAASAFFQVLETNPEYAHRKLYWLPVVGLSMGNLGFAAGFLPIPYILSCEMFSTGVRGSAQTVFMIVQGLSNFLCIKTFINIQDGVGNAGTFFVYSGICAAAAVFVVLFVKEAKPEVMR